MPDAGKGEPPLTLNGVCEMALLLETHSMEQLDQVARHVWLVPAVLRRCPSGLVPTGSR